MNTWDLIDGVVDLPDGRRIRGTGLGRPRSNAPPPDFAVYLQARDPAIVTWPNRWVRWRDFGLPSSTPDAIAALEDVFRRAASERVEVACSGGIGRTGSALAVIAIMSGVAPDEAVTWVRANYHHRAVETRWQRRWVEKTAADLVRAAGA